MLPIPTLTVDGLVLSEFVHADAPELVSLVVGDAVMHRYAVSMRSISTEADAIAWMDKRRTAGRVEWAARDASGRLVGRVAIHDLEPGWGTAEIGYGVFAPFRGRGVASTLARTATAYAFDELALERVELVHAIANLASCGVAQSCGYAFEGVKRHSLLDETGAPEDAHLHARLRGDPPPVAAERPVQVEGHGLTLRPYREDDAAFLLAGVADPAIALWNPLRYEGRLIADLAEARWLAARFGDWSGGSRGRHCSWVVESAGQPVGHLALYNVDLDSSSAGVGYWVAPEARGAATAARAVDVAAQWAYRTLGLRRLELFHAVANPASCAVALRAGFRLEGEPRASYRYGDGELYDEHAHARLAEDPAPSLD